MLKTYHARSPTDSCARSARICSTDAGNGLGPATRVVREIFSFVRSGRHRFRSLQVQFRSAQTKHADQRGARDRTFSKCVTDDIPKFSIVLSIGDGRLCHRMPFVAALRVAWMAHSLRYILMQAVARIFVALVIRVERRAIHRHAGGHGGYDVLSGLQVRRSLQVAVAILIIYFTNVFNTYVHESITDV